MEKILKMFSILEAARAIQAIALLDLGFALLYRAAYSRDWSSHFTFEVFSRISETNAQELVVLRLRDADLYAAIPALSLNYFDAHSIYNRASCKIGCFTHSSTQPTELREQDLYIELLSVIGEITARHALRCLGEASRLHITDRLDLECAQRTLSERITPDDHAWWKSSFTLFTTTQKPLS